MNQDSYKIPAGSLALGGAAFGAEKRAGFGLHDRKPIADVEAGVEFRPLIDGQGSVLGAPGKKIHAGDVIWFEVASVS